MRKETLLGRGSLPLVLERLRQETNPVTTQEIVELLNDYVPNGKQDPLSSPEARGRIEALAPCNKGRPFTVKLGIVGQQTELVIVQRDVEHATPSDIAFCLSFSKEIGFWSKDINSCGKPDYSRGIHKSFNRSMLRTAQDWINFLEDALTTPPTEKQRFSLRKH